MRKKTTLMLGASVLVICILFATQQKIVEAWMRLAIRNEYIVVSLTTTPYRIYSMRPVIEYVLEQKIPLKALYINIPYVFKRDNMEYVIPEYLSKNPRLTILRPKDYGPGTKLLGTLEQADLPADAILITVDDDITYPKNMLLHLAYAAKRNPDKAIGLSGMRPHYNKKGQIITDSIKGIGLKSIRQNKALVPILEGFGGIAYRPRFFDKTIFALEDAPRECRNSDDLYISFYLARNNIPRQVLRTKYMHMEMIAWNRMVGFNRDALHQLSPTPAERHRVCVAFMKQQYPEVEF